jgi:predicted nucleic acid-binding protein
MNDVDAPRLDTALYLFGFVSASGGDEEGEAIGRDVMLVPDDDVALAASIVRARDYEPPPDSADPSRRLDWVAPLAMRHHDVVQRLHAAGTVVPLKFGALCPDMDHAVTIVRRLHGPIAALLKRFAGKDEWTLTVGADREALAGALKQARPGLLRLEQDAAHMTAGAAYLARKRLQQLLADLIVEGCDAIEERVWRRVADAGAEFACGARSTRDICAGGVAVAHGAVLVARERLAAVERVLGDLEMEHESIGLSCELSGPWPPYSFAETIEVG